MSARPSGRTSELSRNRVLILLSGEGSSIPEAEARSLIEAEDQDAKVFLPEPRVMLAETNLDPDRIASRIAYARRVGIFLPEGRLGPRLRREVERGSYRMRCFRMQGANDEAEKFGRVLLRPLGGRVDLVRPYWELSVVAGAKNYAALTRPILMSQRWAERRPRGRAFFHPSAIYPKLSRALVNLSGIREGEILLDPFCGSGSILLEAHLVGALAVGVDLSRKMVDGASANQRQYAQSWLGLVRADSRRLPVNRADAIVTDVPYGRASSTFGEATQEVIDILLTMATRVLAKGSKIVVMHPNTVKIGERRGFEMKGQHHLYVHRNLTRSVSVLKRS